MDFNLSFQNADETMPHVGREDMPTVFQYIYSRNYSEMIKQILVKESICRKMFFAKLLLSFIVSKILFAVLNWSRQALMLFTMIISQN